MKSCLVFLISISAPAYAEKQIQVDVLVIHSYHSGFAWTDMLVKGIDEGLHASKKDLLIFHEFLDAKRYPSPIQKKRFFDYLKQKYQDNSFDLIMVSDDPAMDLVLAEREQWLPDTPIVFLGLNHIRPGLVNNNEGITGVFEHHAIAETLIEAVRLSDAAGAIVINDSSSTGQSNLKAINSIRARADVPEKIIVLTDLVYDNLSESFATLPENWPVLPLAPMREHNSQGPFIDFQKSSRLLRQTITNPIFTESSILLNNGAIGGYILDGMLHARLAAELASQILTGVPVSDLQPVINPGNRWIFDAAELSRLGIERDKLPANSTLINAQPSFYESYRTLVWGVLTVFIISFVIIVSLVVVLRIRGRTEQMLRRIHERLLVALDASSAGVFEYNLQNNIINYVTPHWPKLLGYHAEEIPQGKALTEWWYKKIHPQDREHVQDVFEALRKGQKDIRFEYRIQLRSGEWRVFGTLMKRILTEASSSNDDENYNVIGIDRDITERKHAEEELRELATSDSLTKLHNRTLFLELLDKAITVGRRNKQKHAILFLDLDNFKNINDSLGHEVGDLLLCNVAQRIVECTRESDTVARLGGDEFIILIYDISMPSHAADIAAKIIRKLDESFRLDGHDVVITPSIGIAIYPDDGLNTQDLLRNADTAMYAAKNYGRRNFKYFTSEMNERAMLRQAQEEKLRKAINDDRIVPYYQPKIDLETGKIAGMEVLARWPNVNEGFVSTAEFIPIAEETGLITQMDQNIFKYAVMQTERWLAKGFNFNSIAINLSPRHFQEDKLLDWVDGFIENASIPAEKLELEITEVALIESPERAIRVMEQLRDRGIHLTIDDFGTGFSALNYLRRFPVDALKIDVTFIRDMCIHKDGLRMVESIINLAHNLDLQVVAEGVESLEQLQQLKRLDCDLVQGFYFSQALPANEFEELLLQKKNYFDLTLN